ncbi:MAG: NAD(P)/FAD-dependent oxidoreductase [bacterium]|nr:NAD(P)/FAD-dependent oxidoreductase [bacterium]
MNEPPNPTLFAIMGSTSAAPRHVVVVGNGMVSARFCDRLLQCQNGINWKVTIIGDEAFPAYDRVHLSVFFERDNFESLLMLPSEWYRLKGIDLRVSERVDHIDLETKHVTTSNGDRFHYDDLVLATGSEPYAPPIRGIDTPGVFFYRTLNDLKNIQEYGRDAKCAAIIGGGLLGLEAAQALLHMNIETHILEIADFLLPKQLNREAGEVLLAKIESLGIHAHLQTRTTSIQPIQNGLRLIPQAGDPLDVDMVIISAGVRPRDRLAKKSGIACSPGGGILVDETLRTSNPSVYAIGDCVNFRGHLYGLVAPGYRMAAALAASLNGEPAVFIHSNESTRLKLLGVEVSNIGHSRQPGECCVYHRDGVYRECFFAEGSVIGAISIGPWPEEPKVLSYIENGLPIGIEEIDSFVQDGMFWPEQTGSIFFSLPDAATICTCMSVRKSTLCELYESGRRSVAQLACETGASTVCGSCLPLLKELTGESLSIPQSHIPQSLLVFSSFAAVFASVILFTLSPLPFAESVESAWRKIDVFWRNGLIKQISGYTLLTLSLIALLFSLRKRVTWLKWGEYSWWRMVHAVIGMTTLLALPIHTGFRLGANMNEALMISFILLCAAGAFAGAATGIEALNRPLLRRFLITAKPYLTYLHIALFWPIPILIAFHILAVYYY